MRRNVQQRMNRACQAVCEPMEARRMLSAINWVNKGTGPGLNDTDGFNAMYGANATLARSIAQRAVDDWERVIPNFNGAAGRNTLDVTISASSLGGSLALATNSITYDALDKPSAATFTLDDNAGGLTWYFDSTPGTATVPDDSDFINHITPFASERVDSGMDFYRYAARGVGFALGLAPSSTELSALTTDVGDDPNSSDPADRLLAVDIGSNGSTEYTLTTAGAGRSLFEGGIGYNGPVHPYELLNNARTLPTTVVRRLLISDTSAEFLRDVYNYTVTLPSLINTFYVNLNTAANTVTVTGDANFNNDDTDNIDLETAGTAMSFEVNGTDETIEGAEFTSITVNANTDSDDIDVDQLLSGKSVTVNGGSGADSIGIAPQFGDIDSDLGSDITVNGGPESDTLHFNDSADGSGADTYTITSPAVQKGSRIITHSGFEHLEFLLGSPNASTWNINSTSSSYDIDILAGNTTDTFNVGNGNYDGSILGDINIDGYIGNDMLNINDENDAGAGDYTLTATSFSKTSGGGTLTYDSMSSVVVNGSNQPSTYNVDIELPRSPVTINAGGGNDVLDVDGVGNDIDTAVWMPITFNGQNGNDLLDLNDTGDAADTDIYTISLNSFAKSSSQFTSLTFTSSERLNLTGNDGENTIEIDEIDLGMNVTLNGGGGNDLFTNTTFNINSTIFGNVTLNGAAGSDTVTMNDENDVTATEYTLTNNTFQVTDGPLSGLVTYNNDETFNLKGNAHDTDINVDSTKAGVAYELRGNAGDDVFNFGGPGKDVDGLLADVTVVGGPDNDAVNYLDDNQLGLTNYYSTATETYRVGAGKVFPMVESILISAGDESSSVHIDSVAANNVVIAAGNDGSDGFFIGNGNWDANILNQVLIIGGNETDAVTIDDKLDTGNDPYNMTSGQINKGNLPATTAILVTQTESVLLDGNTGGNLFNVTGTVTGGVRLNGNAGADSFLVSNAAAGTLVQIDGGTQLDAVDINTDAVGTVAAFLIGSQDLDRLHAFAGATISTESSSSNLLYTRTLTIDNTGKLDLNANDMIVDYAGFSPIATVQGHINTARNGGAWNGATGLTSTTASNANPKNTTLGVLESNEFKSIYGGAALFDGQAIDITAVLVKYTYYGDTDFSGVVDFDDYSRIDSGFNGNKTGWLNGDVDYNGVVDFDDYSLIDQAFNTQTVALRPAGSAPTPTRGGN